MDSRTPDELTIQQENELICQRLLKWKPARLSGLGFQMWHPEPYGDDGAQWAEKSTPCFDTWTEAGLIMDALGKCAEFPRIGQRHSDLHWYCALKGGVATVRENAPLAVRAAALEFIRRPS